MKIYSPSSTLQFQTCPRLWQLSHQWYVPTTIGNNSLAAAFGTGFHKGMELLYKPEAERLSLDEIVTLAVAEGIGPLRHRLELGHTLGSREEKTYELLPGRIEKAVRRFVKVDPFPKDWHNYLSELVFPTHGNCRLDLLFDSDFGPTVLDFKTKVTTSDWATDCFMFDAETSWQLAHNVFAARAMGIPVVATAICLVIAEPFDVRIDQWVVDEARQARWLEDAVYWWAQMEQMEAQAKRCPTWLMPGVGDHRTKYGLCEMHALCTEGMSAAYKYTQIPRG